MTAKELKQKLLGIPNDAEVFLECDHGQNKERAASVCVDDYDKNGKITAILISY